MTGLERCLATRQWTSFGRYAALDRGRADPFATGPVVAAIEAALAALG